MRTSTAYFAGVGTVIVAVAAGLGGGYLAANVVSPPVQAVSKLERRMSAESVSVSTAPAEPASRVVATTATNSPPAPEPEQPSQSQTQRQPQPQPQTQAAAPVANPPAADEKAATPREAFARASEADIKRAAADKRRAERRQQSADRRRWKQPREQELDAVEDTVRETTEPRRIRVREDSEPRGFFGESGRREIFAEPVRSETTRIRLFGQDD
jgi:hypothetical protein